MSQTSAGWYPGYTNTPYPVNSNTQPYREPYAEPYGGLSATTLGGSAVGPSAEKDPGLLEPLDAVKKGLAGAYGLISNDKTLPYPNYVPSQKIAPNKSNYIGYTPNQPMAQIQTPNYQSGIHGESVRAPGWQGWSPSPSQQYQQVNPNVSAQQWGYQATNPNANAAGFNWQGTSLGMERVQNPYTTYGGTDPTYQKMGNAPSFEGLMGGDYDRLQAALQTPGEIAARNAYEQGNINLNNQMGARGLYGSSIMANQAREALERPYMDALSTNAASAAATRYAQQVAELQSKNQFAANIYGQQMGENQAANQMGFNTWDKRLGENLAGQGYGLEAQKANQGAYGQLQGLMSNQGLAQNQAGLDYSKLLTGVNQQNVANSLAQNTQMNELGLNYAQMQNEMGGQNANRALQQATAMNALQSGDMQQLNNLMSQQNLAKNTFAGSNYAQQLGQLKDMNAFNIDSSKLGMTQNQNVYEAGVADAARKQDYNLANLMDQRDQVEQQRAWQNAQNLEKFQYDLANLQYKNQMGTQQINQWLSLAGLGAPLGNTQMNNQNNSNNAWLAALGGLIGNYLK